MNDFTKIERRTHPKAPSFWLGLSPSSALGAGTGKDRGEITERFILTFVSEGQMWAVRAVWHELEAIWGAEVVDEGPTSVSLYGAVA